MKHSFLLVPPRHLNQPFDGEAGSGGGAMSEMTRRKFLKRTGGAAVASLIAWNLSTSQAAATETEGGGSSWEYALKCKNDPTDLPLGAYLDSGRFKIQQSNILTPFEYNFRLVMSASGPTKGQISTSMEVEMLAMAGWERSISANDWAFVQDACLVEIDPTSGIVTVLPLSPVQKQATSSTDSDLKVFGLVDAAFTANAYGLYHDDSFGWASAEIPLPGGLNLTVEKDDDDFHLGPLQLSWVVVVVRRLPGGNWQDAPESMQPSWITQYNQ